MRRREVGQDASHCHFSFSEWEAPCLLACVCVCIAREAELKLEAAEASRASAEAAAAAEASASAEAAAAASASQMAAANAAAWSQYAAASMPQSSADAMAAYWKGQNPYEAWTQQQQQQQQPPCGGDPAVSAVPIRCSPLLCELEGAKPSRCPCHRPNALASLTVRAALAVNCSGSFGCCVLLPPHGCFVYGWPASLPVLLHVGLHG